MQSRTISYIKEIRLFQIDKCLGLSGAGTTRWCLITTTKIWLKVKSFLQTDFSTVINKVSLKLYRTQLITK